MTKHRKAIVLAIIGIAMFYLLPWKLFTASKVAGAEERAAAARTARDDRQSEIDAAQTVNRARLEAVRAELGALMPERTDLKELIDDLVDLADRVGVRWEQSSVGFPSETRAAAPATTAPGGSAAPAAESAKMSSLTLDLRISGSQDRVLEFLTEVRDLGRLVLVENLAVNIGTGSGGSGFPSGDGLQMSASMGLRAYSFVGLGDPSPTSSTTASTTTVANRP